MLRSFFAHFKLAGGVRSQTRFVAPVLLMVLVMAACGASPATTGQPVPAPRSNGGQPAATPAGGSGSGGQPTLPNGTPTNAYLIRSLSVNLVVNKPLDAERQLNQDVFAMDPLAQAAGEQINQ